MSQNDRTEGVINPSSIILYYREIRHAFMQLTLSASSISCWLTGKGHQYIALHSYLVDEFNADKLLEVSESSAKKQ